MRAPSASRMVCTPSTLPHPPHPWTPGPPICSSSTSRGVACGPLVGAWLLADASPQPPAWASCAQILVPPPSPLLHPVLGVLGVLGRRWAGEEMGFPGRRGLLGSRTWRLGPPPGSSLSASTFVVSFGVVALLNLSPLKGSLRTAPCTTPSCLRGAPWPSPHLLGSPFSHCTWLYRAEASAWPSFKRVPWLGR